MNIQLVPRENLEKMVVLQIEFIEIKEKFFIEFINQLEVLMLDPDLDLDFIKQKLLIISKSFFKRYIEMERKHMAELEFFAYDNRHISKT